MKETNKIVFYILVFFSISTHLFSQSGLPIGRWNFDDSMNILKADIGSNLELSGIQKAVDGPDLKNGAVRIGQGSFLKIRHGISPNGGGTMVNEYSVQIDFRISNLSTWHCLFQTNSLNANDGEGFINSEGFIGVQATGYSKTPVKPNTWYRLVISVKNGTQFRYYIEGQPLYNGFFQAIDGRFALENILLLFADNDGEDGEIDCAEAAIWNYALSVDEVRALGGYGHEPKQLILLPYLQAPTENSIHICWHDPSASLTKIEYGLTTALGQTAVGTSELISEPYRWHSVKLSGLQPNTEYYYKATSGSGSSNIYSFRTQPAKNFTGKIRFLLLSDTHTMDTTNSVRLIKEAKKKMQQLYGDDYYRQVNLVLHSGDLVVYGNEISQWTDQYFAPMSNISPNIPFMTVTGNHEAESSFYYSYMKYDEASAYPAGPLNEKFWSLNIANTVLIGLNSNMTIPEWAAQTSWLDNKLSEIQTNSDIDFVLIFVHHLQVSELWGEGISDLGSGYVRNQIIPVLKKYSKVAQLSYGHTHGFERGTIESEALNSVGDFRIVCGGGGGGAIDLWGAYRNTDFPSIHISLDHYCFQLIEIDISAKTFESVMYSLGNSSKGLDAQEMDRWYRKLKQHPPEAPVANPPLLSNGSILFNTSEIKSDSLMTVRIQVALDGNFNRTVTDTLINWKNIFGVDPNFNPIDKNRELNLTKLSLPSALFAYGKTYSYRVKYRDHNLRWSEWSNAVSFNAPQYLASDSVPAEYALKQNFPNPFNPKTYIVYNLPQSGHITLKIYNVLGKEILTLVNEEKTAGQHQVIFDGSLLSSGVYFYKIQAGEFSQTKKLILIK